MKFQIIVFLVIGLISLIRTLNQNKKQNQPGGPNLADAPARRQKVQSEIDAFLEEVRSATGTAEPDQSQQQVKQQRARQQRARQRRRQQAQAAPQAVSQSQPVPAETSHRPLGSGITDHVDSYISQHVEEHVDSKVDEMVEVHIADNVKSHLGNRADELPTPTKVSSSEQKVSARFRELLKSREGVRQAILLNEVLTRPRSLRR